MEEKCPKCGSIKIVKILYGMPTEETLERAERGEIVLGGCCISGNDPIWHCKECDEQFGKRKPFDLSSLDLEDR